MASCKLEYLAKWHFLLFLWYILIFWSQKCWFIELNLPLGSQAVCWPSELSNCMMIKFQIKFDFSPLCGDCAATNPGDLRKGWNKRYIKYIWMYVHTYVNIVRSEKNCARIIWPDLFLWAWEDFLLMHWSLSSKLAEIKSPETKTIYSESSWLGEFKKPHDLAQTSNNNV